MIIKDLGFIVHVFFGIYKNKANTLYKLSPIIHNKELCILIDSYILKLKLQIKVIFLKYNHDCL